MPEPEPQVTEIAPDIYRISGFVSEFNLQFNHFLVKDEEPLLSDTGLGILLRGLLPDLRAELHEVRALGDVTVGRGRGASLERTLWLAR
jgi:hypothetical protein